MSEEFVERAAVKRPFWVSEKPISLEQARAAAKRLINAHFRNDDEPPRISIPAKPDYDDDLVLLGYLWQQEQKAGDI